MRTRASCGSGSLIRRNTSGVCDTFIEGMSGRICRRYGMSGDFRHGESDCTECDACPAITDMHGRRF